MIVGIEIVWWIGLIGALIPTAIILKQVSVILRTLGDIHNLACSARDTARAMNPKLAASGALAGTADSAVLVREASANINRLAELLNKTLEALAGRKPE